MSAFGYAQVCRGRSFRGKKKPLSGGTELNDPIPPFCANNDADLRVEDDRQFDGRHHVVAVVKASVARLGDFLSSWEQSSL